MHSRRRYVIVACTSLLAAIGLGLLDRETTSLASLFSTPGNWAGLALWSLTFAAVGSMIVATLTRTERDDGRS